MLTGEEKLNLVQHHYEDCLRRHGEIHKRQLDTTAPLVPSSSSLNFQVVPNDPFLVNNPFLPSSLWHEAQKQYKTGMLMSMMVTLLLREIKGCRGITFHPITVRAIYRRF